MNIYVNGNKEVCVNSTASTLEMPETKGGPMLKWTKKDARTIVPVSKMPEALTKTPEKLPESTKK